MAVLTLIGGAVWRQRVRDRQAQAERDLFRGLELDGRLESALPQVRKALAQGADPNARVPVLDPPLNSLQSVRTWFGRARHPQSPQERRITALSCAALNHQSGSLKALLDAGAKVDGRSDDLSLYPVNSAIPASMSNGIYIFLLRDKEGDSLLPTRFSGPGGITALMVATDDDRDVTAARLLLGRGADVNAQDGDGDTALMNATATYAWSIFSDGRHGFAYPKTIGLLLDRGAAVNTQDKWGRTALMLAAGAGSPGATRLLLARGADATLKDTAGQTAYARALKKGCAGELRVLRQFGVTQ